MPTGRDIEKLLTRHEAAERLGFHADFVRDFGRRGQDAIIDRVEQTNPGLGKMLRYDQVVGTWIEERGARKRPTDRRELTMALADGAP